MIAKTGMVDRASLPTDNLMAEARRGAREAHTTPNHRLPVLDRNKVDPQVVKAAEGMEAMFLDYLMKVMRETVPESEMGMESPATRIYKSMMDSDVAQKAARAGGVGLADQLIAYMVGQEYTKPMKGHGAPEHLPKEGSKP